MSGGPALRGRFAGQCVFAWSVQDGDAEAAIGVDVWVVERLQEAELWVEKSRWSQYDKCSQVEWWLGKTRGMR